MVPTTIMIVPDYFLKACSDDPHDCRLVIIMAIISFRYLANVFFKFATKMVSIYHKHI